MNKRVYKFTRADYGISTLKNRRLKLSTIKVLNDPFDLCPVDTSDQAISDAVETLSKELWQITGVLCFSRNWDNLLLWSHYAAAHTGICLGFDIVEHQPGTEHCTDVLYQPNLLQIRRLEDLPDIADRLKRTKHECWSYEQEVRMFVNLDDPPDAKGLHWIEFGPLLVLKEVIIGAQCDPAWSKNVQDAIKAYGNTVGCWWAGMRSDAFQLIREDHPPHWHAHVR